MEPAVASSTIAVGINYLAILVAAIAAFVIGFLWHGPLFGKQWIKLSNIPQSEVDAMKAKGMGPMVPHMIAALVLQFVMAFVIAHFLVVMYVTDVASALSFAFWVWLGFIATVQLNAVLWEKRTIPLYLFNIAYHLVSLIVMVLILVYFPS